MSGTQIPSDGAESPVQSDGSSLRSDTIKLKRTLGLFNGVALIIGVIVGSGIFVSPKGVLIEMGSVGAALLIWGICGVICLLGALSFAELGTCITKSGGMYAYIKEAFGDFAAFLYLWVALLVIFPAANAVIALTCGEYILQPFYACGAPDSAVRLMAIMAISFLTFINCMSVKVAARIGDVFSVIKVLSLIIIIIAGLIAMGKGKVENFKNGFEGSTTSPLRISLALYSGLFTYSGWYTLNFLTEELKNPYKNLPRAIWISMPMITIIYVLANAAYFAVLTPQEVIDSEAVAVTFADKLFGIMAWIMPLFVALSTFGSLNGCILSVSRVFFVGARNGHLPQILALINTEKFTPLPSVVFEGIVSVAMLFVGDVFTLINAVAFVEAASFLVCTLGLMWFRYKYPLLPRPIKVNLALPIIFAIICTFLVIFPVYSAPGDTAIGLIIMATGIPVYIIGVKWKNKPKSYHRFMNKITILTQKLIMGMPQDDGGEKDDFDQKLAAAITEQNLAKKKKVPTATLR